MAITPDALLEFARTIATQSGAKNVQKLAKVTRIEDGITYISIPGGETETPISTTGATLEVGDTVSVSVESGQLRANTNISHPSISQKVVNTTARAITKTVQAVGSVADEAAKVANAVNQHFWSDSSGVHVTEANQDATTEHNILVNSYGILLRHATNYLTAITQSAVAFYDGSGNSSSNIVAQFGSSLARVGKAAAAHVDITSNGVQIYNLISNSLKSMASFGSTVRIGPSDSAHLLIYTSSGDSDGTSNVYLEGYYGTNMLFRIRGIIFSGIKNFNLTVGSAKLDLTPSLFGVTADNKSMYFSSGRLQVNGNTVPTEFVTDTFTKSYTIGASDNNELVEVDISKSGYTPISVWRLSPGSSSVNVRAFDLNSSTIEVYLSNTTSSSISNTLTVQIGYLDI